MLQLRCTVHHASVAQTSLCHPFFLLSASRKCGDGNADYCSSGASNMDSCWGGTVGTGGRCSKQEASLQVKAAEEAALQRSEEARMSSSQRLVSERAQWQEQTQRLERELQKLIGKLAEMKQRAAEELEEAERLASTCSHRLPGGFQWSNPASLSALAATLRGCSPPFRGLRSLCRCALYSDWQMAGRHLRQRKS